MLIKAVLCSILMELSISVRVMDIPEDNPKKLGYNKYVNKFCPYYESCGDRSHQLCAFNPNVMEKFGSNCALTNPPLSMSLKLKRKLLQMFNQIRSRAALGKETGKDGVKFPRAYGMYKLHWDDDLAELADLRARLCGQVISYCISTVRFPKPFSITTTSCRSKLNFTKDDETLTKFILREIILKWYKTKNKLTDPVIIPEYEYFYEVLYQALVNSNMSHLGCGIRTFHTFHDAILYKNSALVCYFSHSLIPGDQTYHTKIPEGHTTKCGCPPGSAEEISSCLCVEESSCTEDLEPNIILLPLIQVENAMPKQMPKEFQNKNDTSHRKSMTVFTSDESIDIDSKYIKKLTSKLQERVESIKSLLKEFNETSDEVDDDPENIAIDDSFVQSGQEDETSNVIEEKLKYIEKKVKTDTWTDILHEYAIIDNENKKLNEQDKIMLSSPDE